jgi:tripartite-type tricarboxylate transporter receptor subunit TctC
MLMRLLCLACFAFAVAAASARADVYPSRRVTVIVPYPAGGTADVLVRILAENLKTSLGQPLIVENIVGGGGSIGTGRIARAAPDGYTIGLGDLPTHVLNGAISALPYELLNDFEPVALLADSPLWIVARNSLPPKNLNELIAWLRVNQGKASQGIYSNGGVGHLCGLAMQKSTGLAWQFVPYRGTAQAMQDLLGGQIDLLCATPAGLLPMVRTGQINPYAVTATSRMAAAPEIPTVDEAGLPGVHISLWFGLWAPKGTPQAVIARLNTAIMAALANPTLRTRLADLGLEIPPVAGQTPESLRAYQQAEIEKWWPIIKAANIKPD